MVFKKCLRPCPSDESRLSIGRVSNEYQHDWVSLVFRYICGLVPPTKVTSLLQVLTLTRELEIASLLSLAIQ